jgi:hypothetical protein
MRVGRLLAVLVALAAAAAAVLVTAVVPSAPEERRLAAFSLDAIEPAIAALPFKGEGFVQAPGQQPAPRPPGLPPRSQFNPRSNLPFGLDAPRRDLPPGAECFRPGLGEPCVPICAEPAGAGGAPLPLCAERRPEGRPPTERG